MIINVTLQFVDQEAMKEPVIDEKKDEEIEAEEEEEELGKVTSNNLYPPSLSFAKLVMMSSTPAKSAGNARYTPQDPFVDRLTVPYNLNSNLY